MHFYLETTVLYYSHRPELTDSENRLVLSVFKAFEQHVSFRGYRWKVFSRLNVYDRFFALCYYLIGTTRHTGWLYRLIHKVRHRR